MQDPALYWSQNSGPNTFKPSAFAANDATNAVATISFFMTIALVNVERKVVRQADYAEVVLGVIACNLTSDARQELIKQSHNLWQWLFAR
jgi:hypothetical protein